MGWQLPGWRAPQRVERQRRHPAGLGLVGLQPRALRPVLGVCRRPLHGYEQDAAAHGLFHIHRFISLYKKTKQNTTTSLDLWYVLKRCEGHSGLHGVEPTPASGCGLSSGEGVSALCDITRRLTAKTVSPDSFLLKSEATKRHKG